MHTAKALAVTSIVLVATAAMAALPNPANGGKDGGPIDLLLLKGHSEWSFGTQPDLDAKYQQMLKDRGYRISTVHEWQELTPEFLGQFNTVVYLNPSAYMNGGYFDHTGWRSGRHLLTVQKNVVTLRKWVEGGGGLLLVPTYEEMGMRTSESINHLLDAYGLETTCACVRDTERAYQAAKEGFVGIDYPWTEAIGQHPISQGVKRIYYPSYCTRWDDNYTTIPLKPKDAAWTVVVKGMPGSTSDMRRSPIYDPKGDWTAADGWNEPAIMVARDFGKGRVAVIGISSWHLFYKTYCKSAQVTESAFSRIDGIPMTEGDGTNKSDLSVLLDNAYRWLAEGSLAAGMGGYDAAKGIKLPAEDHSMDNTYLSDVWADEDPMCTGEIRPMKILVGARSAISNGHGTPQQWAEAAKAAGYDVVCFTETFEHVKQDQWAGFADACRKSSDDKVTLVPGFDIDTDLGNRFLIVGHYAPMRKHLLTPDGKKLFWTGHMMIGMGDVLPIAARPQHLATVRGEQGALPPDNYAHLSGIAVATYDAAGKQVDDGFFAYKWNVSNSTIPFPVSVHEVSSPGELATAVKAGLQNYVNSDTPEHAAFYYRQGFTSYGGNPARYYVSSGPMVDSCKIDNWQSPNWTISLKAHDEVPITEVLVNDQMGTYRRFTPKTKEIDVSFSGDLGRQHWFITELRDANGGRAIMSGIRTLPMYSYSRCMDRQNFFGQRFPWLTYIGYWGVQIGKVDVPGVQRAADYCVKPQMFYGGNRLSILEYVLDSTYVPNGTYYSLAKKDFVRGGRRYGADNQPLFNDMPIPEYAGKVRYYQIRKRGDRRGVSPTVYAEVEVDVEIKKDLKTVGDVWPIIGQTAGNADYYYARGDGQKVRGVIEKFVDLPEGALVGDIVTLSPLRVNAAGQIGFAPPAGGSVKAGTTYRGSFTKINKANADAIARSMGLSGATPYKLNLTQGKLDRTVATVHLKAENGGVAGNIVGAEVPPWGARDRVVHAEHCGVPVKVHDANPRWVGGLWTGNGAIEQFGFIDGALWGAMLVDENTPFYFGNLLIASDPNLNLAFASDWTAEGTTIEVNNPTDKEISATITTPKAITDRKAVNEKVTVPAGTSVIVEVK